MKTRRRRRWPWLTVLLLVIPLNLAHAADDDDDDDDEVGLRTRLSGHLSSDVRYSIPKLNPFWCKSGAWCHGPRSVNEVAPGFSRNENIARMRFTVRSGDYKGVAEVDFVWTGFSRGFAGVANLAERETVDPFRLENHALYFDITDFLTKGLDVRIGRQIVEWGKADMFNPTSNLNALDLEDTLLFGDRIANDMVKIDYNFWRDFTVSLVWVPLFRPNQLPASAALAVKGVDRIPIVQGSFRRKLHVERDLGAMLFGPTVVTQARPVLPENRMENSQVGFKLAGKVAKMDFSLSYYYGRHGTPQPYVERTFAADGFLDAKTELMYPRMHVLGFNWAGQIPLGKLGGGGLGIGFWFELAVYFPQKVVMPIYQAGLGVIPDGEYDYDADGTPGGTPPTIVASTPFAKWVLGFDYTFNKHVFMNVQWVHGFPEEFGAGDWLHRGYVPTQGYADLDTNNDGTDDLDILMDCGVLQGQTNGDLCAREVLHPRIGDYLVAGLDLHFLDSKMLLRLFFILDMTGVYVEQWVQDPGQNDPTVGARKRRYHSMFTSDGFSMILFPQLTYSVGYGIDLSAGALISFGKPYTKFGDPATGGTVVFGQGKFSF